MKKTQYIFDNKLSKKEVDWLISQFPNDYESLNFLVYNDKNLVSVVNKKKSNIEIVINEDQELNNFYKVTRDQNKHLISSMKKLSCKKRLIQETLLCEAKSNLKQAEKYIFIQKMTKNKKTITNTKNISVNWSDVSSTIKNYSNRIKEIIFVENNKLNECLKTFNSNNYFVFLFLHKNTQNINNLIETSKILNNSKSKVLIFDLHNPVTRKVFHSWSYKKINKKDSTNNFCVWKNY